MEDTFKYIDITIDYEKEEDQPPEVELTIRTIKERFKSLYHQLPYNAIPKVIVRYIVKDVVQWINMFSLKGRVSKT